MCFLVTIAAAAIFSYASLVPLALWGFLLWRNNKVMNLVSYTFMEIVCVYGYSLAIYIPAVVRLDSIGITAYNIGGILQLKKISNFMNQCDPTGFGCGLTGLRHMQSIMWHRKHEAALQIKNHRPVLLNKLDTHPLANFLSYHKILFYNTVLHIENILLLTNMDAKQ